MIVLENLTSMGGGEGCRSAGIIFSDLAVLIRDKVLSTCVLCRFVGWWSSGNYGNINSPTLIALGAVRPVKTVSDPMRKPVFPGPRGNIM